MKSLLRLLTVVALATGTTMAQTVYQAFLSGLNETPVNASPGSGFGQLVLNASLTQITVDESWSGLTAPATASHIHGPAGAGTNAPILFPFSGVPAATAGSIPTQTFSVTPAQVSDLNSGLWYFNVHSSTFPGGEIRGQILLVPEPSTAAVFALGVVVIGYRLWRRKTGTAVASD